MVINSNGIIEKVKLMFHWYCNTT